MEERPLNNAWVGVDVGKEFHWAHVLDTSGRMLLSRRVENDEADTFWPSSRRSSPSQKKSSGRPTSPEAARHCCWRFCGSAARR